MYHTTEILKNSQTNKNEFEIVIQVKPAPVILVRENGEIVSSQYICSDIHDFWTANIKLNGFELVLTYDGKQRFTISYENQIIWSAPFNHTWDYVGLGDAIIKIEDLTSLLA